MENMSINDNSEDKSHTIEVTKSSKTKSHKTQPVKIVDFNMPFVSMVSFMIKWVLASIPAFIMISIVGFIISMIFHMFDLNLLKFT